MDNNASIKVINGLGDKLLDVIGFFVICKHMNYNPIVAFDNTGTYPWGTNHYDERLFVFKGIEVSGAHSKFYVNSPMPSASLGPFRVYQFLKSFFPSITFDQISRDFFEQSKQIIQPSDIIRSKFPPNIENAYGIHLRRSDKINNCGDIRHVNTVNEFTIIINHLLEDVHRIIVEEPNPSFLIVSEEEDWKKEITQIILQIASNNKKQIQILDVDYSNPQNYHNYKSVLDMFCLSKCKEILQGVKYSTFSVLASLLGNGKIRNYSNHTETYYACLIHSWSSVLEINNAKTWDIGFHGMITQHVDNMITNISKVYNYK